MHRVGCSSAASAVSRGAPLVPRGAPLSPLLCCKKQSQLQQVRGLAVSLSAVWEAVRERFGGGPRKLGPRRGPPHALKRAAGSLPPQVASDSPAGELSSPSSEAVQRHLMKVYKNPTPEELKKAKRQKTTDPVFFRQLGPDEFEDYRAESLELLHDKKLCFISPRQSAARELPLQTNMRTPLQDAVYRVFGRHREYPDISWQMLHIILERVENEQLRETFGIPEGFNGSFYLLILHLWLLHCRLCQGKKAEKSLFFADPILKVNAASSAPVAALQGAVSQQQRLPALSPQDLKAALTRGVYGQRLRRLASPDPSQAKLEASNPASVSSSRLLPGSHAETQGDSEAQQAAAPPSELGEQLAAALRIEASKSEISGELINEYLFQQTWGLVTDWLRLKKVGQFQLQAELKNCQAYAFGLMVSLDQALTEPDIFPARVKEALWGNVYSGEVAYGDRGLSLLTKYTIRQLLHILQLEPTHFLQARFSCSTGWLLLYLKADFPLSPHYLAPPLLPPLSLPVTYGGFAPSDSKPAGPLLEPSAWRSRLITK
ncbi:hypothetical protein Emed_001442 [Eimeria media]